MQGLVGVSAFGRFRTRLNHVIEVAQIAGALADQLGANRPLAEAIALAHDLGHPPFGHAGERALDKAMRSHGGPPWNANLHSLAVVDTVEAAFVDFPGLNLTWTTREGIARHSTPFDEPESFGEFVRTPQGGIECQIVDASDVLAYLSHDLDDAIADRFVDLEELTEINPRFRRLLAEGRKRWAHREYAWPQSEEPQLVRRFVVARLISAAVKDIVSATQEKVVALGVETPSEARSASERVVVHSEDFADLTKSTISFLVDHYYRSDVVRESDEFAERVIVGLFDWFVAHPDGVPERFRVNGSATAAATYIASLNDRNASALMDRLRLGNSAPAK